MERDELEKRANCRCLTDCKCQETRESACQTGACVEVGYPSPHLLPQVPIREDEHCTRKKARGAGWRGISVAGAQRYSFIQKLRPTNPASVMPWVQQVRQQSWSANNPFPLLSASPNVTTHQESPRSQESRVVLHHSLESHDSALFGPERSDEYLRLHPWGPLDCTIPPHPEEHCTSGRVERSQHSSFIWVKTTSSTH